MDAPNASPVTLDLIARAAALSTGDAAAARWITARVASAHPRPERERESTLVKRYLLTVDERRERARTRPVTPEPLGIADATLARLRAENSAAALDLAILHDVLRVGRAAILNALDATEDAIEITALSESEIGELSAAASAIETGPLMEPAAREIERAANRRRRFAYAQAIVFLLIVGLLVYVKIDLKRAADEERANAVPSLIEQFSNPLPPDDESSTP